MTETTVVQMLNVKFLSKYEGKLYPRIVEQHLKKTSELQVRTMINKQKSYKFPQNKDLFWYPLKKRKLIIGKTSLSLLKNARDIHEVPELIE